MKSGMILFLFCVLIVACKEDTAVDMDKCESITGATFTSNSGRMRTILQTKCGISGCHVPGGEGAAHWVFDPDYADLQPVFSHMYDAVSSGLMPPPEAADLTTEERDLFKCWHDAGFPE